jgi:PKD repeat protein
MVALVALVAGNPLPARTSSARAAVKPGAAGLLGGLPLYFVQNQGQRDHRARYYLDGAKTEVFFTARGLNLVLNDEGGSGRRWNLALDFVGAGRTEPEGVGRTAAVVSYFRGRAHNWHKALPTYAGVVYRDLWPGIDLEWSGEGSHLKYQFVVRPGAKTANIRLRWRGATGLALAGTRLKIFTPVRSLIDDVPASYQWVRGRRVSVATSYVVDGNQYGFGLGRYDRSRPLVVDPDMLIYAGYIGGAGEDSGQGIAVDKAGAAYITGSTTSTEADFPASVGPDLTYNGGLDDGQPTDVFVAKVAPDGRSLLYAGYIGGAGNDAALGIAVDGAGAAYVTGDTSSGEDSFPVTVGPDLTFNGGDTRYPSVPTDAFVAKVAPDGASLIYAGYVGGAGNDAAEDIDVDGSGNAYVTGLTGSTETTFPVAGGPDRTYNGGERDAFVAKVAPDGASLSYAGYIGGSDFDFGGGIAVDATGNAYIAGGTSSTAASFPVAVGPDLTFNGASDAFVAKVDPSGSSLSYAGYIGGSGSEAPWAIDIAVDAAGAAYVTGDTSSTEATFPVAVGPDLTHNGGLYGRDGFVAKVKPSGAGLWYAGYIGGSDFDIGVAIAVDAAGAAYVTGETSSTEVTFPVAVGPDLTYNGVVDAFVAKVEPSGASLSSAGYVGGDGEDRGRAIAVDGAGAAYITGSTSSLEATFPAAVGPDLTHNGIVDAFVAKISPATPPPDTTPPQTTITSGPSGTTTSTSATFQFTATEPSTFECSLDAGAFEPCASPTSYAGLGEGAHTFRVRATDAAGNTDPTAAERTWTIQANTPPTARFTFSCSALTCSFDGSASADPDGTIQAYSWVFGDGTSGSGRTADHTYAQAAGYTVTLTVTDDAGTAVAESKAVILIRLTATGYKVNGVQRVDLSWSGPSGTSFDVYRDGRKIATVLATTYTDNLNRKGSATYTYLVCAPSISTCSNQATVKF